MSVESNPDQRPADRSSKRRYHAPLVECYGELLQTTQTKSMGKTNTDGGSTGMGATNKTQ